MKPTRNLAWHFTGDTLRDGSPIPADGVWLEHNGPLVMCESGLHWSRQPFDALSYAPGGTLCLVDIGGKIIEPVGDNKGLSSRRLIVARMDATELLWYFARMQALSRVHLWDVPDIVLDYLMTGDEGIRSAAWRAADNKARSAAWSVAESAAWRTVRSAAWSAAWSTAWNAAWSRAWNAAWSRAWNAAGSTAENASRDDFNALVYECFEGVL